MKFFGIQKMTLLDFPERVAATLFTGGCNFRCPFCHNASLVVSPTASGAITDDEVIAFLKTRQGLLDGVCITGGEPLLQTGLTDFIREVRTLGFAVKIDTNGSFPERLRELVKEKLVDYVAMDIKNSPQKYGITVGLPAWDMADVLESAHFLMSDRCEVPYEFRTTIVREFHTAEDMEEMGRYFAGAKHFYLQTFKDSGDLIEDGLHACDSETMQQYAQILRKNIEHVVLRDMI